MHRKVSTHGSAKSIFGIKVYKSAANLGTKMLIERNNSMLQKPIKATTQCLDQVSTSLVSMDQMVPLHDFVKRVNNVYQLHCFTLQCNSNANINSFLL